MAHPFATDENRCFSAAFAVPVSTIHQQKYCLTAQYDLCPVYRQAKGKASLSKAKATPVSVPSATHAAQVPAKEATSVPVGERVTWLDADDETLREMNALFGVKATLPQSPISGPLASPTIPLAEQTHPDFTAHQGIYFPPQPFYQNDKFRRLVLILLLLALVPVAWWLFANAPERPGFLQANSPIQGSVAMPTVVAPPPTNGGSGDVDSGAINGGSVVAAGVSGATEATATPAAEATLTDLERIAVTATALFANATTEMECIAPSTWESYTIEKGDTIDGLARSRGVQRELLIVANCLSQSDLEVGRTIFLPPGGAAVDNTTGATLTPTVAITVAPTWAPVAFPTVVPIQFPSPTVVIIIYPTVPPPTGVPPTTVPPTDSPTQVPPEPTPIPTAAATAAPPPPPQPEPTSAPPPGEP